MRLIWAPDALEDRIRTIEHVAESSPRAALALDERTTSAVGRLAAFPESGRRGRVPGTREMVIAGTPLVVVYAIADDEVRLLRVLHGAQRWPTQGP